MTETIPSGDLNTQLRDLVQRWLNLAAQARKRATDKPKGELFALYDKATADAYELTANDLSAAMNERTAEQPPEDFIAQLYGLAARWDAMATAAKERAATTSLGGAHHFGTAAALSSAVNEARTIAGSKPQR
jgi:hypothetical protein